jgi:hypothetical protein
MKKFKLIDYVQHNITNSIRGQSKIFRGIGQISVGSVKSSNPDSEFDKHILSSEIIDSSISMRNIQEMFNKIRQLKITIKVEGVKKWNLNTTVQKRL